MAIGAQVDKLPGDQRHWLYGNMKNVSSLRIIIITTKGGIAVRSPPNSSFVFARWQHSTDGLAAICDCMF